MLSLIDAIALRFKPTVTIGACTDPDDDCFLECAEAGGARFVVTGNKRHFPPSPWRDIYIVTARELLDHQS